MNRPVEHSRDVGWWIAAFMGVPLLVVVVGGLYCGWGSVVAQLFFGALRAPGCAP